MMNKSLLIFLVIASFTSNYFLAQNIIAETFNSTGGPYPKNNMCPSNSKFIGVKITNKGPGSLPKNTQITITVKITGPNNTSKTFTEKFNTPTVIAFENSDWFTFVSPANIADLSKQGAYDFAIVATYTSDTPPTAADGFDAHQELYVAGNVVGLVSVSPDRSLCKSAELDTIAYQIFYNADSAYASNLPPGVSTSWKSPRLKIFGKPTTATNSPYNYTVRATGACPSIYDSTLVGNITVKDLPVLAYIGNDTICEGFTSAVSPSSLGSWSSSAPSIATITNSGAITGLSTGKTLFTFTKTATGCFDTLRKFIVNPLPIVDPIAGPTKVCVNAKIQLTNTNKSGTWKSLDPARATINTATGEVTGVSEGTSIIEYMVVSLGCTTVVTTTITVNKLPSVGSIFGTKQACIGLTTQLSNTTLTGVWATGNTGIATISGTGLVTGKTAGSSLISYTVTNLNGCVKSDTTTIRIYAFPSVAAITGTTTLCEGATTQLADATVSGVWSSGTSGIATIDASGLVIAITAGTSSISYVVSMNNCSTTVNSTITVNTLPIVPSITGSTNICVGATSQLLNPSPGGVWTSGTPAIANINSSGLVSGLTPGTSQIDYTVTILGCSTTKSTTVNTFSMPSINPITGDLTVCAGATSQLSNITQGGTWSSSTNAIATINTNGVLTGITSGQATITYSVVTNGVCPQLAQTTIIVNATPIVSEIKGNSSVCQGSTTLLSNATPGGTWKSDTLFVATIDGTLGNVKALNIGETNISYSVTQMGCSTMVSKKINVQAKENANFTYSSTNYCPSESDPTPVILGTKGGVFSAAPNGLSLNATTGKISLANSSKGNYAVTYKTLGFCSSERTWDIIIGDNSSNTLTITSSSGKDIFCMGDSLKLIAQGATKYLWNTGKTDNFITVKNPGKYTVTSKDAGCSATVSFDVKVDTLRLYMSVPSMVLVNNGFVTLNGNPKEGTFSGAGVNTNIFDPKLAGLGAKKITFNYVSPNKCSAQLQQTIVVYDTVSTNCTVTKYDTVKVTKFDTLTIKNNVYDTVTITNNVTKYDTITVKNNVYDTITVTNNITKYDTVKVTKFDTITIKNNVYDTVTITNNVTKYDTITVKNNVYDTITVTNNVTKYDTVKVTKFDTITIKNNVYDTVTITNSITKYDTIIVPKTVTKYDTITVTNNVTKYDTVIVNKYDTITVTNNVTKYDTITLTDTVSILKITFKLTTGIQANQMASMSLYPNPTTDVLHIEIGDAKALDGYRYRILDALGKEVYNELVKNAITEIPLKTLGAAGMYQFEVLDQKNVRIQTNKIVLQ